MTLKERADKIAAERQAERDAEAKEKAKDIDKLAQEANARRKAKERQAKAQAEAKAKEIAKAEERDLENRVKVRFPGIPADDFKRLLPELRDRLLVEEADARGRQKQSAWQNF